MPSRTSAGTLKKDLLLKQGIDLMYVRGYNGTSIKDIVDAAGIPKGSFYFYFDSKEDFAIEALNAYLQETNLELQAVLNSEHKTDKQRLLDFFDLRIRHNIEQMHCSRGCFIANMASEMASSNEALRKKVHSLFESSVDQIAKIIRNGQQNGSLKTKTDSKKLASAIEDAWKGALVTMKSCRCEAPLDNFRNIILKQLLV
ncbi:MAG: TetR/AcrR family transcriptional regulator [Saprospiraceae bacterium]|nr:TetR/AcrR family transcriptional regulator [Saprospiraceae bacterium]